MTRGYATAATDDAFRATTRVSPSALTSSSNSFRGLFRKSLT